MEPLVFKTDNDNYYFYSPSEKALIPIPHSVYQEISNKGHSSSSLWTTLDKNGFLRPYHEPFDGQLYADIIKNALVNLSQVVFETTTICNLRCEYCCYSEGYTTFNSRRDLHGNLKFKTAKAILDYLSDTFMSNPSSNSPQEPFAISFYGGEPLMNFPIIKEIVEYAETINFQNRSLSFTMTTNSTLLAKYADFLQKHKFKLLISLDGDKAHNAYRKAPDKKESFDRIMANLNNVKERYPDWFKSFRYNVVYTDISNVKEIVSWYKRTFDKIPNFSVLHTPTKGAKDYIKIKSMVATFEIPHEYWFDYELLVQSPMNKRVLELCNHLLKNTFNKEPDFMKKKQRNYPTGTCIPFSKRLFVSFDGKIHPCEKVNRDKPLGEITDEGEVIIDCNHIAHKFMNNLNSIKSICQRCYLQSCCTRCFLCFDKDGCKDFTNKEKFSRLLSKTISYIEKYPEIVQLMKKNIIIK